MVNELDYKNNKRMRSALCVVLKEVIMTNRFGDLLLLVVEVDDVNGDIGVEVVVDTTFFDVNRFELLDNIMHDILDSVNIEVETSVELVHDTDEFG